MDPSVGGKRCGGDVSSSDAMVLEVSCAQSQSNFPCLNQTPWSFAVCSHILIYASSTSSGFNPSEPGDPV
ncbi:unnamed protein product [Urochloa humidicola]